MINPERLQELLSVFAEEAKLFFYSYGLADLVIDLPVDLVAIKALNRAVYEEYLKVYRPLSKRVSSQAVDARDIALCELYEPLDAGTFGKVPLLEILEPKPGAIATTYELIDHIELVASHLQEIDKALKSKGILYKEQKNGSRTTLVMEINEWGQEVKISDQSLREISGKKIAAEKA
jgi:predicted metalloenzyme YecM